MSSTDLGNFDIQQYAAQANAILGIRDSGKSYSATMLAERLMDSGVPIIAFDPIGVWHYLRVPGKGQQARGYPVAVIGGERGHMPLREDMVESIVRSAIAQRVSVVFDFYSIETAAKSTWKRVVEKALRTLLYCNQRGNLIHIFLEEAAEFAPQTTGLGEVAQVYALVEQIARMGGNKGVGLTLVNQRAEQVNKAVLELCDCVLLHRQKGKNSLKSIRDWLAFVDADGVSDIIKTIPMLEAGECWLWTQRSDRPRRVKMPAKHSLHPDRRERDHSSGPVTITATPSIDSFINALRVAEPSKPAKAVANNAEVAELRRQVGELQAKLAIAPKEIVVTKSVLDPAAAEALRQAAESLRKTADDIMLSLKAAPQPAVSARPPPPVRSPAPSPTPRPPVAERTPTAANGVPGGRAERSILAALHQHGSCTKAKLAIVTGYASNGGGFNNALGSLRSRGLIQGSAELSLTASGSATIAGSVPELPTGPALLDHWKGSLDKAGRLIFEYVAGNFPSSFTKEEIAAACGYEPSGGGFNNALGKLRTLGLINRGSPIAASEHLFA